MEQSFFQRQPKGRLRGARRLFVFVVGVGSLIPLWFPAQRAWASDSIQVLAARAEQLEAQGEWQQAAAVYKSILKIRPDSLAALNRLGALYVHHHEYQQGIEYYQKALKVSPDGYVTNLNLGIAYVKMSNFPLAVVPLGRAARAQPLSFRAHELLGVALIGAGNYARAIPVLEKAREIKPQDVNAEYLLVRAYMAAKEFGKALNVFNSLESSAPQSAWVHILKGQAYEGLGSYRKALGELEIARQQAPDDAIVPFSLGFIYWKTNQLPRAEAEFMNTLKIDSQFENARFYLADCYLKEQQPQRARVLLKEVVQNRPDDYGARLDLGKALFGLGRNEDAVEQFQAAIRLHPADSEPHYLLSRTYQKMKRMDAYKHELQVAQKLQSKKLIHIESLMSVSSAHENQTRKPGLEFSPK